MCKALLWFILGSYSCGCVDIADEHGDILHHVDPEVAKEICKNHNINVA
jgi:hypothetical protein